MIRLLAHQGGWDEALLFVAPLAIAFIAINAFERRARKQRRQVDPPTHQEDETAQNNTP